MPVCEIDSVYLMPTILACCILNITVEWLRTLHTQETLGSVLVFPQSLLANARVACTLKHAVTFFPTPFPFHHS